MMRSVAGPSRYETPESIGCPDAPTDAGHDSPEKLPEQSRVSGESGLPATIAQCRTPPRDRRRRASRGRSIPGFGV